jgi:hypothetical protein
VLEVVEQRGGIEERDGGDTHKKREECKGKREEKGLASAFKVLDAVGCADDAVERGAE